MGSHNRFSASCLLEPSNLDCNRNTQHKEYRTGFSAYNCKSTRCVENGHLDLQGSYLKDLESLLARYKAHGDIDKLGTLNKENKRLAAYEGKYRELLERFDGEVVKASASAKEAAADMAEAAAVEHMQACPTVSFMDMLLHLETATF